MAPHVKKFAAIRPENPRALDPKVLADLVRPYCQETEAFESYDAAISFAMEGAFARGCPFYLRFSLSCHLHAGKDDGNPPKSIKEEQKGEPASTNILWKLIP